MLIPMPERTANKRAAAISTAVALALAASVVGISVPYAGSVGASSPSTFAPLPGPSGPIYVPRWPVMSQQPFQKWNRLGTSAEGLLVATRTSAGPVIDWLAAPIELPESADRQPSTYLFVEGKASPWAVYFASKGEGYNFLSDWQVPTSNGVKLFDAAAFEPTTPNPWGLTLEAHLVKVQVNGGDGSAGQGPHFVITDAQVLDGSAQTPIVPSRSLAQGLALWKRWLSTRKASISTALNRANKQTPGIAYGPETTVSRLGISPTWDAATQELHVRFYERRERRSTQSPACVPSPRVRCARPAIRSYGVEMALELRFDRKGNLVRRTNTGPLTSPGIIDALVPPQP